MNRGTTEDGGRWMIARYATACTRCSATIDRGSHIVFYGNNATVCARCADRAATPPPAPPPAKPTQRGLFGSSGVGL